MLLLRISDLVSIVANCAERNLCTSASMCWTCRYGVWYVTNPLKKVLQLSKSQRKGICLFSLDFFMLWVRYLSGIVCHMNALGSDEIFMSVTIWHILEPNKSSLANLEGMNNGICVLWQQVFISILLLNKIQVNTYNQKCMKYSPHLLLINMCITICTTSI